MAGHSKWAKLKHVKGKTDAQKAKLFSKLVRFISIEAKKAKGDRTSPGVRAAVEKARAANMPADNIERAIDKASTTGELEPVSYEAYGPGGVSTRYRRLYRLAQPHRAGDKTHTLLARLCARAARRGFLGLCKRS